MENDETIENGARQLCAALAQINDPQLMEDFMKSLLTESEFVDVAKRWLLVREIDNGTTQREIARAFNMSLCKITRGSRMLKEENSAFRRVLDAYKESEGR